MNNTILTILSLSISGSVLALVLLALRPLLKNNVSKTFFYYIWLLVLVRLALPLSFDGSIMNRIIPQTVMTQAPVISIPDDSGETVQTQGGITPQSSGQNTASETPPATGAPGTAISPVSKPAGFDVWAFAAENLTAIWLLGALVHFGWFIIAYLRFSRKIKRTSIQPHAWDTEVFAQLRGDANVRFVRNPYVNTPMLVGLLSPCIVIPHLAFTVNGMEPELRHILLHELTHYRRRDLLYKWFAVLVSSLHWFNPLMILVRREISRACELSCDETVIRQLNADERQDYGETLLAIASNKRLPSGIVTTTMCEEKRELKERLESIMAFKSKSIVMVALSLVLALVLAGCGVALGAAKVNVQTPDEASHSPVATETPVVTTAPEDETSQAPVATDISNVPATPENTASPSPTAADNSVMGAYSAVLQNKAEYVSTDNKKKLYLNDFLTNKELYGTAFDVTHFTVLDMDGDNVPEVVLELSVAGEPQFYEVLHYMNGEVYGYLIVYRGLEALKADGTFGFSNGAADYGWGRLILDSDAYATDMLAYSQSGQDGTNLTISYFINNEPAEKQAFDSFANEQSGKKDAVWHEFSKANIVAALSANA